jgi:AP-3 complex subunit mu
MEKHWKSVVSRSVLDYFFDAQKKATSSDQMPVIIPTPSEFLISIFRHKLHFVSVVKEEVSPLLIVEFLHRVVDIFEDYFSGCSEVLIKEHYVVVYELLDEMLDNGYPLATESNILKELIKPPTVFRAIANSMTGRTNVSSTLPHGQISQIPWRRSGVKYANNEAYFDIIEEVDAIIDRSGSVINSEIQGCVDCCIKLSGNPDLLLSYVNPRLFDDVSFHPCVRFKKWEQEKVISFIPPDGNFRLMSYLIGSANIQQMPIAVRHSITFRDNTGGKIDIQLSPKSTGNKALEGVVVECKMPKTVLNVNVNCSQGKQTFDSVTKMMVWEVGRIEPGKAHPFIRGNVVLQTGAPIPDHNPVIHLKFMINQFCASGVKVNRLDMYAEKYKPFKGVKYVTRSGNFQIRT